jgi:transcriptional regulator with XRE-family HTH domain
MSNIASRIQQRLDEIGLSANEASERAGLGRNTINQIMSSSSINPRHQTLVKIAKALNCTVEFLISGITSSSKSMPDLVQSTPVGLIRVAGIAEAGRFKVTDYDDYFEPIEAPRHPLFPKSDHVAYRVVGDSMDKAGIRDGDYVIGVCSTDAPEPRVGDIVVVEKVRAHFAETTIKRITELVRNRKSEFPRYLMMVLSPESSNPIHRPIILDFNDHVDALGNGESIEIKAVVVSVVRDLFGGRK